MNFDAFEQSYEQSQVERIRGILQNIQQHATTIGRSVPENEDLVIGTGRRLSMAVMFLDICGYSSRLSETQGEQDLILKSLNLFFTEMVRIAEDYGGTVEKNTGDGLMAYFEDEGEQLVECGSKRAVACGLTMFRTAACLLNPIFESNDVKSLAFRISIDHGMVTVARLGAAKRFNAIVAVGTAANVACKMLRFAGPDEMIIGDTVKSRLPAGWHQFVIPLGQNSGWVYRRTGAPYPFYRYTGRWRSQE